MEDFLKDLIGPALVAIVSFLAITMQVKAGSRNISKQIREQINADRDQRFWNIRLDSIIELHLVFTESSDILTQGRIREVNDRLYPVIMNISTLFKNEAFIGNAKNAFEILLTEKDGVPLPLEEYLRYGNLIIETIDAGLTELGAFELSASQGLP